MAEASSSSGVHDYTEGASPLDIQQAIANSNRTRRDSRYGEDGDNMFDGPGHSVNPSSVSRMTLRDHGRRSSGFSRGSRSRRRSEDSVSRGDLSSSRRMSGDGNLDADTTSNGGSEHEQSEDEGEDRARSYRGRRRRKSPSPPAARSNVFENLASIFGRGAAAPTESPAHSRRPSMSSRASRSRLLRRHSSRRSDASSDYAVDDASDESGDERWGYSSNEEDESEGEEADIASLAPSGSDMEFGSYPPSPGATLPLLAGDPVFGSEARIEMGELDPLPPPPSGSPSRQTLYIADEDAHIRMIGYEPVPWKEWLWRICCVCTFGVLALLGRWFPRLWLRWVTRERAFIDMKHGFVVVEVRSPFVPLWEPRRAYGCEDSIQGHCSIPGRTHRLSVFSFHSIFGSSRPISIAPQIPPKSHYRHSHLRRLSV